MTYMYQLTICCLSTQVLHVHVCSLGSQFLHGLFLVPADGGHERRPPFVVLGIYINVFKGEKEIQDIAVAIGSRDVKLHVHAW